MGVQVTPHPAGVGSGLLRQKSAAINPMMLQMLEQLMQQQQQQPAAPQPAQPATRPGVDPSTFARPVDFPEDDGGIWGWLSKIMAGNAGNNQRLALDRMISGSRGTA